MIEFQDVSVVYANGHAALSNVSLRIEAGEFVCIVGPTGAGKSTLLKLIYREAIPTSGRVIVRGLDLSDLRPRDVRRLRRRIGVVSQDFGLLPSRTLFENVALPLRVMGVETQAANEKVHAALERVGLLDRRNDFPHQASAGEQQLTALARALVHDPSILIADQPTRNLDPNLSMRVEKILSQINASGATVVLALNDRGISGAARPRVAAFDKGRLVGNETWIGSDRSCDTEAGQQDGGLTPEPLDRGGSVVRRAPLRRPPWSMLVREARHNIRCKGLASLAALLAVIFAMMALGGALAALYCDHQIARTLPLYFEISVFLPKDLTPAETLDVKDHIAKLSGVAGVRLVAKEEAWTRMKQEGQANGSDLADALEDENPLPDRLDVRVDNPHQTAAIADHLGTLGKDYKVRDEREALNRVLAILQLVNGLGGATAVLLFLVAALVMRNTLRSTILARRHEFRIMQWVGASPSFIRSPLAMEGIFYGTTGGAVAGGIVLSMAPRVSTYAQQCLSPFVQTLPPFVRPEIGMGTLVGIGMLAGLMGSTISIKRLITRL